MLEVPHSIWGFRELPAKSLEMHILRRERYEICEKSIQQNFVVQISYCYADLL
jgi:hypothetical protein